MGLQEGSVAAVRTPLHAVAIPEKKVRTGTDPGPPAVVLITGVMASGQSTVAELLAGQLPRAAHVRGDVFRWMAVSGREELLPEETTEARAQLDLCYLLSALVADGYAHHGWTAVVQDIILGDDLTRYIDRVHTRPLFVVVLAPAIAVGRAREAARPKAGYGVWTVEARDHALRAETPPIGLWLDTSEHTPTLTVSAFSTTSRPRLGRAADPRHHAARPPKPASSQP